MYFWLGLKEKIKLVVNSLFEPSDQFPACWPPTPQCLRQFGYSIYDLGMCGIRHIILALTSTVVRCVAEQRPV